MHLTSPLDAASSRGSRSAFRAAGRPRYARTSRRMYASKCTQMRVHTDTHARARVSAYTRPCLAARKRKGRRRKRRRTGEVACKFASGIASAEMQKSLRDRLVGQIREPHLPPRDRRVDERAIRERYGTIRLFFLEYKSTI